MAYNDQQNMQRLVLPTTSTNPPPPTWLNNAVRHHHHQNNDDDDDDEEEAPKNNKNNSASNDNGRAEDWETVKCKAEIVGHPLYEQLLSAHVSCLRIATPVDQLPKIDAQLSRSRDVLAKYSAVANGRLLDDKELDQFMVFCFFFFIFFLLILVDKLKLFFPFFLFLCVFVCNRAVKI